ncbi:MAG: VOC family protein [Alphaproteobacteria bacterium]
MARVTGIGGVFFKARDPDRLIDWYRDRLGIAPAEDGNVAFHWRESDDPDRRGRTIWAPFPSDTQYFEPSTAPFMINYRVDDLDALLERLRAAGVEVDDRVEEYDYGRFAWVMDPEGNRIELWQPTENPPHD